MDITEKARELQPYLEKLREEFHRHPETAGQEKETSRRVVQELEDIGGFSITTNVAGYGVLAEIQGAHPGPTLVFRADMDALQIQEETGLACCSQNPGKMHACGHDFHITMLLGGARLLKEFQNQLKGTVRLCFQPSEESTPKGGSQDMIAQGALKDAQGVFGLHVWPQVPSGRFGLRAGPLMAASDHFFAHFVGKASHAARPHDGIDALLAGAQFITSAQSIVSRSKNPLHDAVITMGKCLAGSAYNIVPEHCVIEGTVRTFLPEDRDLVERRLHEVFQGVCTASGCTGLLDYQRGYIPLVNHPAMTHYVATVATQLFGESAVFQEEEPSMASEDFAYYLEKVPGCFAWLTCSTSEEDAPLHNSRFTPDPGILWRGASIFAGLALHNQQLP